jgi:hypothetical protein
MSSVSVEFVSHLPYGVWNFEMTRIFVENWGTSNPAFTLSGYLYHQGRSDPVYTTISYRFLFFQEFNNIPSKSFTLFCIPRLTMEGGTPPLQHVFTGQCLDTHTKYLFYLALLYKRYSAIGTVTTL